MEEKKTGQNVSSGAQKVERLQTKEKKQPSAKKSAPQNRAKKNAQTAEKQAASARADAAKAQSKQKQIKKDKKAEYQQKKLEKKAQLKQKRLEKRAALAQKRAERKQARAERFAKLKEQRVENRAKRLARREMLKNESKVEKQKRLEREKKEKIALKRQKNERKEKARQERMKAREQARERRARERKDKREHRAKRREHAPGFGGWLAAVISLGVACLALTTVVTAGAVRMGKMNTASLNGGRVTLYEMTSISEDMDDNLSKLSISGGVDEQRKLVTNILIDTALLENELERMPVDTITGTDISTFINQANAYCRELLNSLATGKPLTQKQRQTVGYLYEVNHKLNGELNTLATTMTEKDFMAFLEGKGGVISQKFGEMGQNAHSAPDYEVDMPFSGMKNVGENRLEGLEEVSQGKAEELVTQYLQPFHVREITFTGETLTASAQCYNFSCKDENGVEWTAQISKKGGKLCYLSSYENCTQVNFDAHTCDSLAREYLKTIGIENVEAVWTSERGTVANITYVTVQEGVRIYPELIRVRVCSQKGRVIGLDAMGYWLNHGEHTLGGHTSREEAQSLVEAHAEVYSAHLALIPVQGKEVLCHEFACTHEGREYIVYLDAKTLQEVQVYVVKENGGSSYLK